MCHHFCTSIPLYTERSDVKRVHLRDFPQLKPFCLSSISFSFHVGRHEEQWLFFLLHSKIGVNNVGSFSLLNPLLFRLGRKLKPDTEPNPIIHSYLNLWVASHDPSMILNRFPQMLFKPSLPQLPDCKECYHIEEQIAPAACILVI